MLEFGVLYRIDDLDDGSFYIGVTTSKNKWENGYMGSGHPKWYNHKKIHPPIDKNPNNPKAHHYERTILRKDFETKDDLYEEELREILNYSEFNGDRWVVTDPKCMNTKTIKQGECTKCEECGSFGPHYNTCIL